MGTSSQTIPTRHGLAMILMVCTVVFPSLMQTGFGSNLFGAHPLIKVLGIAGIGGAVSGALWGGRRHWLIGSIAGVIAGVGAVGALPLYIEWFHKERLWKLEFILVLLAGALPGVLLGRYLIRDAGDSQQNDDT